LRISFAVLFQSMRPSSGPRLPKVVACDSSCAPFAQQRQGAVEHHRGRGDRLVEEGAGGVVVGDGELFLIDDVAGVGFLRHVMEGDAGFGFAVDDRPVDRHAAAVLRQERTVKVDAAVFRNGEQLLLDEIAIVEAEEEIRRHGADSADPDRVVDVLGGEDGDAAFAGEFRDGTEPDIFRRIVLVRENGADFESVPLQRFNAGPADVVIGQYHTLHMTAPSGGEWINSCCRIQK